MDLAQRPSDEQLLTTADLAAMEQFTLGGVIVSPSKRTLRGPIGNVDVEPRIMQVLVVLANAVGVVVTRETLFNRCWGGVYVGDDSLNRAVAALRRAVAAVGGRFEVETIPKTGYLLTVPKGESGDFEAQRQTDRRVAHFSRRVALITGGSVAAVGAAGLWWTVQTRRDSRIDALLQHAEESLRKGTADAKTAQGLQEAVSIRPDSAKAWGLLALAKTLLAQGLNPTASAGAVEEAEKAARRALSIDPKEPNAQLAMFGLQGSSLDWTTRDHTLRQIIAIDPTNVLAIAELVLLLQAAGLNRESWNWNERALTIEPLSMDYLSKRALKLWIAGQVSQADKVIDQVRALYPTSPWAWWVRFLILALTERPRAAQAMLDTDPAMLGTPAEVEMWRICLAALDQRSTEAIARARNDCLKGARIGSQFAGQGVMILSALGELDAAFDVASGFLLSRGSIIGHDKKQAASDAGGRINTQWLFTPPAALMRADPRFGALCEGVGLTEYWRKRHLVPDYQLRRA